MATPATATPLLPDVDKGSDILGATLAVTCVALISTILRFYARIRLHHTLEAEDYVMLFTMILAIVGQGIIIPQVSYGAGRHMAYVPPANIPKAMKLNFVSQPIYVFAITTAKFSVGLFLLRIAVERVYRRVIIGVIAITWAYTLWALFVICFQCNNISALWNPAVKTRCLAPHVLQGFSYTNSTLCILTDLAFAALIPIPMVWKLRMTVHDKTRVLIITSISLGLFATAASAVKLSYISNYGKTGDLLYDYTHLTIWTVTECCVGIIAGNLPPLRQLFLQLFGRPRLTSRTMAPSNSYSSRGTRLSSNRVARGLQGLSPNKSASRPSEEESAIVLVPPSAEVMNTSEVWTAVSQQHAPVVPSAPSLPAAVAAAAAAAQTDVEKGDVEAEAKGQPQVGIRKTVTASLSYSGRGDP